MNSTVFKIIIRFILLVLVQVLVLNNMNLSGYVNPYVYVLFILLLPVNFNKSASLILAFIIGLTIDFFGNTIGLHAAASVLLAYFRPYILNLFFQNLEFTGDDEPGLNKIGLGGFMRYTFVLVFIHHTALFFLEIFSLNDFLYTLYRIFLSSLVSTIVILISVLFFSSNKK